MTKQKEKKTRNCYLVKLVKYSFDINLKNTFWIRDIFRTW